MAHSSESTWASAADAVSLSALSVITELNRAEETYRDLLEVYNYAGGTDQGLANLLFGVDPAPPEMVSKVTDLRLAITAMHELWLALNNGTVSAADRDLLLRRMS